MNVALVNRLALGTAQFGMPYGIANRTGQPSLEEVRKIIKLARQVGINTIDTAIAYGDSEKVLGQVGVTDFQVITKLPKIPDGIDTHSWIQQQIESSIDRLQINQLYGVLLHYPQQILSDLGAEIINSLVKIREKNLAKKIGVSVYSPEELSSILQEFTPDIVQLPFNLIDRRFAKYFAELVTQYNVEIYVRSAFLQGALLMPYEEITAKFPQWHTLWDIWFNWLSATGVSSVSACLNFVLSFPEVTKLVIGVDHYQHLVDILESLTNRVKILEFPVIASDDLKLVNPSQWNKR